MAEPIATLSDVLIRENEALRAKLAEAEKKLAEAQEVIHAIQSGDVDAVVVSTPEGDQIFTLQGAEYAYRALVEAMNEGAATLGADGTVLYCNQRLSDLLGISLEQIIGNPVANLVAFDAKHTFEALFEHSKTGEPCQAELNFQAGDSKLIPVYVSLREMKLAEPTALCMVVTDLTERKKKEELVEAGELSTSILESAAEAIAVCDETGQIITVNEALEILCGFNPSFQSFDEALPLESSEGPAGQGKPFSISHALSGTVLRAQEVRLHRPDGTPVSLLLTAAPIKASSGVIGCVLTMTDITQRKQAEEALRLSKQKFAAIFDHSPLSIALIKLPEGTLVDANEAWTVLFGYPHPEAVGKTADELGLVSDPGLKDRMYEELLSRGYVRDWEMSYRTRSGKDRIGSFTFDRIEIEGQMYQLGTASDITERKQAEEQLQRLNRALKARSDSSQALLHAADESAYLQEVCRIVTEDCGLAMMWIGFAENDENKTVRPVANAGFEDGYLDTLKFTWDDSELGRGPTGTAIRTGQPSMCRNMLTDPRFLPWRKGAIKRGYASSLVIPLLEENKSFGAFSIYSREPDGFSDAEVSLLTELAADLSFGIRTLRMRAARAHAEEALRSSQAKLHSIVSSAMDAVISLNEQQCIVVFNHAAEIVFQCEASEALGSMIDRFIPEALRETHREHIRRFGTHGVTQRSMNSPAILEAVRSNGEKFPIEATISQVQADGERLYTVILRDITERKQAEEALRESEGRLRSLFESNMDAIFLTVPDGTILAANPAACAMFGKTEEEFRREGRQSNLDPDEPRLASALEERARTSKFSGELSFIRKDGTKFIAEVTSVILPGNALSFVVMHDITERKQAQEALLRNEKLASVGRMASTIAHEINNPLETVGHAVYLAMTDPGTSPEARSFLDLAAQELERITHITRQTLAFHRENKTEKSIDLHENVDSILKLFASRLKSRNIAIEKRFAEVERITAFGGEIQQVISNLLSNSMDAMPNHGKLHLRLAHTLGRNGSRLIRITVADTGSGIAPEQKKKIFEAFFTTKEVVGTGLGLWVTKQIVEKHGGSIRIRSKPGSGTVVSIFFPIPETMTPTV